MKRSIIILLALIILFAMPVLASTPEQENAPLASEDELFLGEMSLLSEEQLSLVIGNANAEGAGLGPIPSTINSPSSHGHQSQDTGTSYEEDLPVQIPNQSAGGGYYNDSSQNPGGVLRCK